MYTNVFFVEKDQSFFRKTTKQQQLIDFRGYPNPQLELELSWQVGAKVDQKIFYEPFSSMSEVKMEYLEESAMSRDVVLIFASGKGKINIHLGFNIYLPCKAE